MQHTQAGRHPFKQAPCYQQAELHAEVKCHVHAHAPRAHPHATESMPLLAHPPTRPHPHSQPCPHLRISKQGHSQKHAHMHTCKHKRMLRTRTHKGMLHTHTHTPHLVPHLVDDLRNDVLCDLTKAHDVVVAVYQDLWLYHGHQSSRLHLRAHAARAQLHAFWSLCMHTLCACLHAWVFVYVCGCACACHVHREIAALSPFPTPCQLHLANPKASLPQPPRPRGSCWPHLVKCGSAVPLPPPHPPPFDTPHLADSGVLRELLRVAQHSRVAGAPPLDPQHGAPLGKGGPCNNAGICECARAHACACVRALGWGSWLVIACRDVL